MTFARSCTHQVPMAVMKAPRVRRTKIAAAARAHRPGDDERNVRDGGGEEAAAVDHQGKDCDQHQRDGEEEDAAAVQQGHGDGADQRGGGEEVAPEGGGGMAAQAMRVAGCRTTCR